MWIRGLEIPLASIFSLAPLYIVGEKKRKKETTVDRQTARPSINPKDGIGSESMS